MTSGLDPIGRFIGDCIGLNSPGPPGGELSADFIDIAQGREADLLCRRIGSEPAELLPRPGDDFGRRAGAGEHLDDKSLSRGDARNNGRDDLVFGWLHFTIPDGVGQISPEAMFWAFAAWCKAEAAE